jgi:hypothetical protein
VAEGQQAKETPLGLPTREQRIQELVDRGISKEEAVQITDREYARTAAVDPLTAAEPKILKPTCPGCGSDPLVLKRLRYDFADGVVAEVLFCRNPECRIAIGTQIVGLERPKSR